VAGAAPDNSGQLPARASPRVPANRNRGAIISANRGKFVRLTLTPNIVANFGPKQLKIYEHKGLSNRNRYTEVRLVLIIGCGDIAQ
jgi:hypothetical protein